MSVKNVFDRFMASHSFIFKLTLKENAREAISPRKNLLLQKFQWFLTLLIKRFSENINY